MKWDDMLEASSAPGDKKKVIRKKLTYHHNHDITTFLYVLNHDETMLLHLKVVRNAILFYFVAPEKIKTRPIFLERHATKKETLLQYVKFLCRVRNEQNDG